MACGHINTPNPASRSRYHSASNCLFRAQIPPRRYDVQTACPHAQPQAKSRHTFYEALSTGGLTPLPQCRELDDSSRKHQNCSCRTPSQLNIASQTISCTTPRSNIITTAVQASTRLGHLEKPFAVDYYNLDQNWRLIRHLLPSRRPRDCFLALYHLWHTGTQTARSR